MRKMKKWLPIALSATLVGVSVGGIMNGQLVSAAVETDYTAYTATISSSTEKKTIPLLSGDILEFASAYEKLSSEKYLPSTYPRESTYREDDFAPTPMTLEWDNEEGALYYTVKVATNSDLSDAVSYLTFEPSIELSDLYMGTEYYYQIIAKYSDKIVKSCIFDFETAYLPRTISIEGVSNTRDIGGYYTVDGTKRVRQGMIYRGAHMENMTQAGKNAFLYTYKIKTDLDLRGSRGISPLGDAVNFVNVSAPYYVSEEHGISSTADSSTSFWSGTYKDALIKEIKTFADPENYPIYIHCSLGRDRTGTLAFLINALLGVGEQELYMDYELTFFSQAGCGGEYVSSMINVPFTNLYKMINAYGFKTTLAARTEAFLLDLGITQAEIDSIRSIMLEEVDA